MVTFSPDSSLLLAALLPPLRCSPELAGVLLVQPATKGADADQAPPRWTSGGGIGAASLQTCSLLVLPAWLRRQVVGVGQPLSREARRVVLTRGGQVSGQVPARAAGRAGRGAGHACRRRARRAGDAARSGASACGSRGWPAAAAAGRRRR